MTPANHISECQSQMKEKVYIAMAPSYHFRRSETVVAKVLLCYGFLYNWPNTSETTPYIHICVGTIPVVHTHSQQM